MTTSVTAPGTAPFTSAVRLVAAPLCEPPFVDEPSPSRPGQRQTPGQEALALQFVLASGLAAQPEETPSFDRQPTATADLPSAKAWVARLAQASVEVLAGARPVAQLRRWTSDEVYAAMTRASLAPLARRPRRGVVREAPRPARVTVRTVRVCEPADGVVEACAVVHDGRRARALVLRLEGSDGKWRCTRLDRL